MDKDDEDDDDEKYGYDWFSEAQYQWFVGIIGTIIAWYVFGYIMERTKRFLGK